MSTNYIQDIQRTNKNISSAKESKVFDAVVIANYGDPGLDQDYYADIYSRYVICILESRSRILSKDKFSEKMIAFVKRPEHLWIDYVGDFSYSSSMSRSDAYGNINVGTSLSYSTSNIPRINFPYEIGEVIKVVETSPQDILYSKTPAEHMESNFAVYNDWHTQGYSYIENLYGSEYQINGEKFNSKNLLRGQTISFTGQIGGSQSSYSISLNKIQYEAMLLKYDSKYGNILKNGTRNKAFLSNGGYYFANNFYSDLFNYAYVVYEDLNVGDKQRTASNSCLPLIVTSPNSFTVPKVRQGGVINYNPSYFNPATIQEP